MIITTTTNSTAGTIPYTAADNLPTPWLCLSCGEASIVRIMLKGRYCCLACYEREMQ